MSMIDINVNNFKDDKKLQPKGRNSKEEEKIAQG